MKAQIYHHVSEFGYGFRRRGARLRLHIHAWVSCLAVMICSTTVVNDAYAAVSFQGLGDLPGGAFSSVAAFVSADGVTVLGSSETGAGGASFTWTALGGMVELSLFPDGTFTGGALAAVTNDGSVMAGSGLSIAGLQAFRWSDTGGVTGLGDLPGGSFRSQARAMSADGAVIVGKSRIGAQVTDTEAFIWTLGGSMIGLGDLASGPFRSEATDVSSDGSVIVGQGTIELFSEGSPDPTDAGRAFRWTNAEGMVDLGLPLSTLSISGSAFTRATAVSSDGSVIVGSITNDTGNWEPFVWTQTDGMNGIGDLPGGSELLWPNAVANNSTIVGQGLTDHSGTTQMEAFIWDPSNGMRILVDVLANDLGLNLTGWTLESATGISDDGLTIVGTGINPNGDTEAFIATLPEPGALAVIVLGIPALLLRRR